MIKGFGIILWTLDTEADEGSIPVTEIILLFVQLE